MKHFRYFVAILAVLSLLCACKEEPADVPVTSVQINYEKEAILLESGKSVTLTATVLPDNATDKTLSWSSRDPAVATVSDKGVVTGVGVGATNIVCSAGSQSAGIGIMVVDSPFCDAEGEWPREMSVGQTVEVAVSSNVGPLTWASSQPSVIELVPVEGTTLKAVLKALSAGKSEITASNGLREYSATITVKEGSPVTEVILNKPALTLTVGNTETLTATVKPDNATDKTVSWSSSDKAVATVSKEGLVTAVKAGSATVTATAGGKSATCEVTVVKQEVPATGITLDITSGTLRPKMSQYLPIIATVTPSNTTDPVVWSVSDEKVAKITYNYGYYNGTEKVKVEPVAPGMCIVTAKAGKYKATCTVTVQQRVTGMAIRDKYVNPDPDWFENEALHLTEGDEFTLKNLYFDQNYYSGEPVAFKVWTEDESVVKGEVNGSYSKGVKIKAIRPKISGGTVRPVRLWVAVEENPEIRDYVDVYVHSAPTGLSISATKDEDRIVKPGASLTLAYTVFPATAKQRVKIIGIPDTIAVPWGKEVSGTSVTLTAPQPHLSSLYDIYDFYRQSYQVTLQTVQNGGPSAPLFFPVFIVEWDKDDVKPLDYVYYNSSTGKLRTSDGGLRSSFDPIKGTDGVLVSSVAPAPRSNEKCVAIITYVGNIDDSAVKEENEYWGYGKLCGFSNAPDKHGFAMAISNAPLDNSATFKWSDDRDDVDASSNWPGMGYATMFSWSHYNSHWQEAFSLTFCAAVYNHRRGNSHDIKPLNALLQYAKSHPVGGIGLGGRDDLDGYNTRWVLPTVGITYLSTGNNYDHDLLDSDMSTLYMERVKKAGGSLSTYFLSESWTINTYDADWAWQVNGLHGSCAYKTNSTAAGLVPWLIF